MWVLGQERLRGAVHVGEIAASAARNADFFARRFGVVHNQNAPATVGRTHHACSSGPDDQCIKMHMLQVPDWAGVVKDENPA